jgi:hypothetical protein
MLQLLLGAGGGLGTIMLGVIVKIYFGPSIEYFAARSIGTVWKTQEYDVRGSWRSTYDYPSRGKMHNAVQMMTLVQVGRRVYGKNIGGTSKHKHSLTLNLNGAYLTGTWRNTADAAKHHGVAQFRVRADGTEMSGRWVGFDGDSNIQAGMWKLVRL